MSINAEYLTPCEAKLMKSIRGYLRCNDTDEHSGAVQRHAQNLLDEIASLVKARGGE